MTPGHDPVDFEIGRDHGLPEPMVIGLDGRMNDEAGDLAGRPQAEADARGRRLGRGAGLARQARALPARGRHVRALPLADRAADLAAVVVPRWSEPAAPAIDALRERRVRYHPESQHRFAIASLEETPDWCLSRQLWWGHQLPIWYTPDGEAICAATEEEAQAQAGAGVALDARPGRARHVVLVGALAVRDARLAGRDARARGATTRATSTRPRARSSASGRTG